MKSIPLEFQSDSVGSFGVVWRLTMRTCSDVAPRCGKHVITLRARDQLPDVTPEAVRSAVETHIRGQGFHIVSSEPDEAVRRQNARVVWLEWKKGYPALATDMDLPISKAIARIVDEAVDGPIVLTPSLGGSLPLYVFSEIFDAPPIVVVPIANHDNNQHAPNENLRIKNLWLGIEIYAALMARL